MGNKDFVASVLIVFLSLWSMLYLETSLENYFFFELFILLLMIILFTGALYGIASKKEWAWKLSFALFIAGSLNSFLLYAETRLTMPFFVALLSNFAGISLSAPKAFLEEKTNSYTGEKRFVNASENYDLDTDALLGKKRKSRGKKKK